MQTVWCETPGVKACRELEKARHIVYILLTIVFLDNSIPNNPNDLYKVGS